MNNNIPGKLTASQIIGQTTNQKLANPASPLSPFSPTSPISPADQSIKKSAFSYGQNYADIGSAEKYEDKYTPKYSEIKQQVAMQKEIASNIETNTINSMGTSQNSSNEPTTIQTKTNSHQTDFSYRSHSKSQHKLPTKISSHKSKKGDINSSEEKKPNSSKKSGRRSRRGSFQMKDNMEYDLKQKWSQAQQEEAFLAHKGYTKIEEIAVTLQGSIGRYYKNKGSKNCDDDKEIVVIKSTNKELHEKGIVKREGVTLNVKEDILKERNLNIILSKRENCPAEFVKFVDFIDGPDQYFLVSEYGGQDLFQWVVSNHQRISECKLTLKKWRDHVRILFSQMCRLVHWLHINNRVCHLDISLENSLIENAYYNEQTHNINKDEAQVKFCDFGVAEMFLYDNGFKCKKYVGKKGYKAPEVVVKKEFNAKKADIWSLGVVLFCMLVGAPPFKVAHLSDDNFAAVISGKLKYLISEYGRLKYMSKFAFDLLQKIFVYEECRISIEDILEHPYVKDVLLAKEQRQMLKAHHNLLKNLANTHTPYVIHQHTNNHYKN